MLIKMCAESFLAGMGLVVTVVEKRTDLFVCFLFLFLCFVRENRLQQVHLHVKKEHLKKPLKFLAVLATNEKFEYLLARSLKATFPTGSVRYESSTLLLVLDWFCVQFCRSRITGNMFCPLFFRLFVQTLHADSLHYSAFTVDHMPCSSYKMFNFCGQSLSHHRVHTSYADG